MLLSRCMQSIILGNVLTHWGLVKQFSIIALDLGNVGLVNTLRPRQNGRHFADDIFKLIFFKDNAWNSIEISLKFVPKGPINNISTLIQIMAWRRPGDKPLFEPMLVSLMTHICVTRLQWVNADDICTFVKVTLMPWQNVILSNAFSWMFFFFQFRIKSSLKCVLKFWYILLPSNKP